MADEDPLAPLRASYRRFLQPEVLPDGRGHHGLEAALRGFFPVASPDGAFAFEYLGYGLERPRHDATECRRRGFTYAAVLKLTIRYLVRDPAEVREQEIFFGEIPLMDADGSFVFAGDRVRLVGRTQEIALPEDGPGAPPRLRTVRAGEWLARAFHAGLAPLAPVIRKAFAHRHAASLMPHDVIEPWAVRREIERLFSDPLLAAPLAGNPAARLAQLARVEGPVAFGPRRARRIGKPAALDLGAEEAARVLLAPAPPRVRTGAEALLVETMALTHRAAHDGTLEILDEETAILWPEDAAREDLDGVVLAFDRRLPGAREGERTRFCHASGARVRAGEIVAEAESSVGGALSLGREARVIFSAWGRGVVVSEAFAEAMRATRLHVLTADLRSTEHGAEEPSCADGLDEDGLIAVGACVDPGSVLVGISSWIGVGPGWTPARQRAVKRRFREGVPRADRSLRAPSGLGGTVIGVELLHRRGSPPAAGEALALSRARALRDAAARRRGPLAEALRWEAEDRLHRLELGFDLPPGVIRRVRVTVESAEPLRLGDRLVDRRGFGGEVTAIVPAERMPACGGARADVVLPGVLVPVETRREARLTLPGLPDPSPQGALYLLRLD
jgi:DNA-directed RNA polymerase beta subunit